MYFTILSVNSYNFRVPAGDVGMRWDVTADIRGNRVLSGYRDRS